MRKAEDVEAARQAALDLDDPNVIQIGIQGKDAKSKLVFPVHRVSVSWPPGVTDPSDYTAPVLMNCAVFSPIFPSAHSLVELLISCTWVDFTYKMSP